jgi:hypothetical protein
MPQELTAKSERTIWDIISEVCFAPSCVDMGWEWFVEPVGNLEHAVDDAFVGWLIWTSFRRPDRDTGEIDRGFGRKWFVPKGSSESAVVITCFLAAEQILKHELMEAFRYKEVRVFDPHNTVEQLASVQKR